MDELKEIRALIEVAGDTNDAIISYKVWETALDALSRLEAREAERGAAIARHVEFPNEAEAPKNTRHSMCFLCVNNGTDEQRASGGVCSNCHLAYGYLSKFIPTSEIERYVQARIAAAKKSEPDFLSQALNEGDGVYRP